MTTKKVSIIITNYHQEKYIKEAVLSVINQTYKIWELIIVDDSNGTDNIERVLSPYSHYANIYFYHTNDFGLSCSRMYGYKKAYNPDYILFLDADDKLHPQFIEKTVHIMNESPDNIAVVYTDTQHFDGADTSWVQPEYNFHDLLISNYICSCSLIREKAFYDVDGYDTRNFNYWEDYELWIELGSKGYYAKHIPEKLFFYRMHPESGTQSKRNEVLAPYYKAYIVNKFKELYPFEWQAEAKRIMNQYPATFISWKPKQQEDYLKEKGLII